MILKKMSQKYHYMMGGKDIIHEIIAGGKLVNNLPIWVQLLDFLFGLLMNPLEV